MCQKPDLICIRYSDKITAKNLVLMVGNQIISSSVGDPIRRFRMFLGLPDPDPFVRGTDPHPFLFP
jgi:hypothetical protein